MPTLYVVATPIGNLGDMTPRAVDTLKSVSLIAAEDTRVTQKLLGCFDIHTPLISCHEHNERGRAESIVGRMLSENIDVALTTDAGTPCISDPGSLLVSCAARAGIQVVAVAGACALACALSVSGLDAREFTFYGFLPRQRGELRDKLISMARRGGLAVAHESPHRVIDLMRAVCDTLPNTVVSVSCDLTKLHEKTLRGAAKDVLKALEDNPKTDKGEYCLVFEWHDDIPPEQAPSDVTLEARLFDRLISGDDMRSAMEALIAQGERKNSVYAASLRVKEMMKQ